MNPVLLKPQTEIGAQVIVQGRIFATCAARDYARLKPDLMPYVLESFELLSRDADLILAEGAGSPAEVNLRAHDIANMGFAEAADLPVVLVGDIDKGGVIAALVGTHALLEPAERARLKGYLINKFRGDPSLFERCASDHRRTHRHAQLRRGAVVREGPPPAGRGHPGARGPHGAKYCSDQDRRAAVRARSRTSTISTRSPRSPTCRCRSCLQARALPGDADLVLLPGSKATLADLAELRAQGWDVDIAAHVRRGGAVLGICGGFQMLGRHVADPAGIEGPSRRRRGSGPARSRDGPQRRQAAS